MAHTVEPPKGSSFAAASRMPASCSSRACAIEKMAYHHVVETFLHHLRSSMKTTASGLVGLATMQEQMGHCLLLLLWKVHT